MSKCTELAGDSPDACSKFQRYYYERVVVRRTGETALSVSDVHAEFLEAGFCPMTDRTAGTLANSDSTVFTDWDCDDAIRARYDLVDQL